MKVNGGGSIIMQRRRCYDRDPNRLDVKTRPKCLRSVESLRCPRSEKQSIISERTRKDEEWETSIAQTQAMQERESLAQSRITHAKGGSAVGASRGRGLERGMCIGKRDGTEPSSCVDMHDILLVFIVSRSSVDQRDTSDINTSLPPLPTR